MTSSEKERRRQDKKEGRITPRVGNKFEPVIDPASGKCIGKKAADGTITYYKKRGRIPDKEKGSKNLSKKQTHAQSPGKDTEMGIEDLLADEVRRKEKKASARKEKSTSSEQSDNE
jgi:hypothetical protein